MCSLPLLFVVMAGLSYAARCRCSLVKMTRSIWDLVARPSGRWERLRSQHASLPHVLRRSQARHFSTGAGACGVVAMARLVTC